MSKSGAGKTTLGVTAPKPLILLTERQGFRSVRDAAERLGCDMPPTIWIQSLEDARAILSVLQTNHNRPIESILSRLFGDDAKSLIAGLPYAKPESIILDSVTEMFALVSDDIEHVVGKKIGRDGLETKPERYWGVLRERSEKLVRKFRDLPYHVFFLALLRDTTIGEGDQATRVVEPACPMRALPSALAAAVNIVGLVSVRQEPRKVESEDGESKIVYDYKRAVKFAGPGWMMTKPMGDLGAAEEADIASWISRVVDGSPARQDGRVGRCVPEDVA